MSPQKKQDAQNESIFKSKVSSKHSDIKHSSLKNNRYDNDKNRNSEEDEKC